MRAGDTRTRTRPRSAPTAPSRRQRSVASRPRPAPTGTGPGRRRGPTSLTARSAVLAVALASVALAVALPFKIWLGQRGQIESLSAQTKVAQHQVQQLTEAQKRWQNPAYVEQQAQQRLHYVLPGHKTYLVFGKATAQHPAVSTPVTQAGSDQPWYSQLWHSVEAAGRTGK